MDATRFDDLLRSLSASPSRRGVTRAFAGLGLGGLFFPLFGSDDAEGKKKKRRKKK